MTEVERNNKTIYGFLSELNVMWGRKSHNEIWVAIDGYNTAKCNIIIDVLSDFNFICVEQTFCKVSGKTKSTFKHLV